VFSRVFCIERAFLELHGTTALIVIDVEKGEAHSMEAIA